MKRHPKSIQETLFTSFLLSMIILISIFTIFFSIAEYRNRKSATTTEMQALCTTIADDIDIQMKQMDNVCLNTINSTIVKESFASLNESDKASPLQISQYKNALANAMTSIRGVDSSIRQINIFNTEKEGFGAGNHTGILPAYVSSLAWYEDAAALKGHRYIPLASKNELLSKSSGTDAGRYYFSIIRMYYDDFHNPKGYVEVIKYFDILFEKAIDTESKNKIEVIISDDSGRILYPIDYNDEQLSYIDSAPGNIHTFNAETQYSGLNVVTAIHSSEFFAPIYRMLLSVLAFFIFALLVCYLVANALSKRLSAPIKDIYHQLADQNFNDRLEKITLKNSHIIEIEKLKNTLNEAMQTRQESMQSLILLKEQEMQARMLALQSQMNPHFLYNSLNTIGAMVEEGMTEPVAQMCRDITSILRYISSNKEQTSSLEEELEHCELYLKCLKLRYGDSLTYSFDIADDLLDMQIPKLCIQLLVENAVKFSTEISPPWHIHIEGRIVDGFWHVDVKDNGPGFKENVSENLKRQMDEILDNGLLPGLELNGMGVLNVFIRFYLLYGITFVFDFGNSDDGGAIVRVGGPYDGETND